jgi:hypothetical protein
MLTYTHWIWSALFWIGLISSALAAVADPTTLGIPLTWMPYIRLLAFLSTVVGGKLGISWLPKQEGSSHDVAQEDR